MSSEHDRPGYAVQPGSVVEWLGREYCGRMTVTELLPGFSAMLRRTGTNRRGFRFSKYYRVRRDRLKVVK